MLFNTLQYLLLFLPVALLVFSFLGRGPLSGAQLVWLVLCSLFFYASWNPSYLLLILGSILGNYLFGRALGRAPGAAPGLLATGVIFNLGLLGYFKYTGFFLDNLNRVAEWAIPMPDITLPLAISFFTFQQIAYLIDVHRGEARDYSFAHYCLFVTFFPQLIAGPIVHHKEMMPQFDAPDAGTATLRNLQVGLTIIIIGLGKKVILADNLALLSDPLFQRAESGAALSLTEAWIAVLAFTGQIYFDFSGYTDMAIGSARLFGIKLPENFFSPYKSRNIIEFWRRWHITLSRFLRDYLYISMGGNRNGRARRYRNLMMTMLLGGLWHGAHWNFVIWGGLHGAYLVINHFWHYLCKRLGIYTDSPSAMARLSSGLLTLLAVMLAWVFFRAESTAGALHILAALTNVGQLEVNQGYLSGIAGSQPLFDLFSALLPGVGTIELVAGLLALALGIALFAPNTQQIMRNYEPALSATEWPASRPLGVWRPSLGYGLALGILAYMGLLNLGNQAEFIYFQF